MSQIDTRSEFRSSDDKYFEFISPLYFFMQLSKLAYSKYLNNKIYLHALTIRSSNQKVYDWIIANLSAVPDEIHDDLILIINHYDIWMAQFKEYEAELKPRLSDSFIFYHMDDQSAFPKLSENKIFNLYNKIKEGHSV